MKKFENCVFVSDMDATLLTSKHEISDKNRNAIEYFIENGGKFTVASGRMLDAIRVYLDRIKINAPAIAHNGAKIYDFSADKLLYEKSIEDSRKPIVKKVYDDMPELGLEIYSNEVIYVYRRCEETKRFLTKNYDVVYDMPDYVWKQPWSKLLLIGDNKEILDKYEPIYRNSYDNGCCVRSGELYLDIIANGVSKGNAAKLVCNMTNCTKLFAIGDSENDFELMKNADISFAVENAVPKIKSAASYQAPHHNNDAIAYAIEKLDKLRGNINE